MLLAPTVAIKQLIVDLLKILPIKRGTEKSFPDTNYIQQ